jgi:YidC/Oxa1 family membrane protein insertase
VDFGWFHIIAVPLLKILNWFYKYVHNYGVAVILLTVLIKLIFWPLSQKSYKSMDQMKKLQPMLTKLREKYADDKERMNQEVMQLYKTYKVNPAGGCLPMVVQIPVFFGLYKALLGSIELRHAAFITHVPFTNLVWLADLSVKDPYYVTPLIMGATMFIQQKMTPTGGDPTQAKIMLLMPVVFTFMFLNFPAGLVVYWLVNNVLSIAQQWWMMRKA